MDHNFRRILAELSGLLDMFLRLMWSTPFPYDSLGCAGCRGQLNPMTDREFRVLDSGSQKGGPLAWRLGALGDEYFRAAMILSQEDAEPRGWLIDLKSALKLAGGDRPRWLQVHTPVFFCFAQAGDLSLLTVGMRYLGKVGQRTKQTNRWRRPGDCISSNGSSESPTTMV